MTINQIKSELSLKNDTQIVALNMVQQLDADKLPTEWVSHWDNAKRLRIVMHQDLFALVLANPAMSTLAYKTEVVSDKNYTRYVVINPKGLVGSI